MSYPKQFIRAVLKANWEEALFKADKLAMAEMLQSFACIDPTDLDELWKNRGQACVKSMPKIELAYRVVKERQMPSQIPKEITASELSDVRAFLSKPRYLKIDEDLTGILPLSGKPITLTESMFEAVALDLNVEVSAIMAVAQVEAGGRKGFATDGRPIIRYELHIFHRLTKGIYYKTHPHLSQPTFKDGNPYHTGKQPDEWVFVYLAMLLRDRAGRRRYSEAWQSTSWGMFQIMGFNYKEAGWSSLESFVADMFKSEEYHLKAFVGFCKEKNLVKYIKDRNWADFAYYYNGPSYKLNKYDEKMEEYYRKIREERIKKGKKP